MQKIFFVICIFFVKVSVSQDLFIDSVQEQVLSIESLVKDAETGRFHFKFAGHGNSALLGTYKSRVYESNIAKNIFRVELNFYLQQITFYAADRNILRLIDQGLAIYFINGKYYDGNGVCRDSADLKEKMKEIEIIYRIIRSLIFDGEDGS